jgi:hypothetical protein
MSGTEVTESLVRLLGHGMPTIILTADPANAEMPWLKNSPVSCVPITLIAGLATGCAPRAVKRATHA